LLFYFNSLEEKSQVLIERLQSPTHMICCPTNLWLHLLSLALQTTHSVLEFFRPQHLLLSLSGMLPRCFRSVFKCLLLGEAFPSHPIQNSSPLSKPSLFPLPDLMLLHALATTLHIIQEILTHLLFPFSRIKLLGNRDFVFMHCSIPHA
jgi:hypothetical protein